MKQDRKIHLLSQELIPIINDIEDESKNIIIDHSQSCEECRELLTKEKDFNTEFSSHEISSEIDIKPLKKLAQFNTGLKALLIVVRGLILFYILYTSFQYYGAESSELMIDYFRSGLYLFYVPAAIFLIVFTFTFFNRKWLWVSLIIDLLIILFLDNIISIIL